MSLTTITAHATDKAPAPPTAAPAAVLRRKCACGGNPGAAGECAACRKTKLTGAKPLQRKLTIGAANDPAEREADRVADTVMRGPAPVAGLSTGISIQRRAAGGGGGVGDAPPIVHDVLASRGRPLDAGTRAFMEPRFGRDLSHVRVHSDARAAESAAAVNARAYTVGRDVVFGAGAYAPESDAGRRLLAHELAHVGQQGHGVVRRACNRAIQAPEPCTSVGGDIADFGTSSADHYLCDRACDHFSPGEEARLASTTRTRVSLGDAVTVHGFASEEGDPVFNDALSCARANTAARVIRGAVAASPPPAVSLFKHGATPGERISRRSVVIEWPRRPPSPGPSPAPDKVCGPDATDWLINQIAASKRNATVLRVRQLLASADRGARAGGGSAQRIGEGGVAKRMLAEERRAGNPPRTPTASAQITQSVPGQRAFGAAVLSASFLHPRWMLVLNLIRTAARLWKSLVETKGPLDFKNDPGTMQNPRSANCPINCPNTITVCPSAGSECFLSDLPGNIVYAHVGRFVGWTELTLQLGSQFAQLDASATWDTPQDTQAIHFSFALPHPLSRADLCAALAANQSSLHTRACPNCSEQTTARLVP